MVAYVYLIAEEQYEGEVSGPWTKIGYSKNPPEWRMNANLKRGNPRDIYVAAAFEFETIQEARLAERNAHEDFDNFKHQKEWFNIQWDIIFDWFVSYGAKPRV